MTKTQYTILFAGAGAAIAFWARRTLAQQGAATTARGEVVFSNTPRPSDADHPADAALNMRRTDTPATTAAEHQGDAHRITM
jgi:hypothetical protein